MPPQCVQPAIPLLRKPPGPRAILRLLLGPARLRTGVLSLDLLASLLALLLPGLLHCGYSFSVGASDAATRVVHSVLLASGASTPLSWHAGHTLLLLAAGAACLLLSYLLLLREWSDALHASALAVLRPRAAAEAAAARPADWREADARRRSSMAIVGRGEVVEEMWVQFERALKSPSERLRLLAQLRRSRLVGAPRKRD